MVMGRVRVVMMAEEGQRPSSTLLISIFMPAVCSILHLWPSLPFPSLLLLTYCLPFFPLPRLLHPSSPSLYPCSSFPHSSLFRLSVKTPPFLSLSLPLAPHVLLPLVPSSPLVSSPSPSSPVVPSVTLLHFLTRSLTKTSWELHPLPSSLSLTVPHKRLHLFPPLRLLTSPSPLPLVAPSSLTLPHFLTYEYTPFTLSWRTRPSNSLPLQPRIDH